MAARRPFSQGMAVRDPFDLEPPRRPEWRSGLTTAQIGPMAEDLLAVAFASAAGGLGTVAWPMVDRGIDLYLRRLRTLLTIPVQVKAFRTLTPDGVGSLNLPVDEVSDHPNGHIAMVHLPPPHTLLYERLFLIPFSEFRRRCPRRVSNGKDVYHFAGDFAGDGGATDVWSDLALDVERLPAWFDGIPGRTASVPPAPEIVETPVAFNEDGRSQWQGDLGRLWAAGEIERAAGPATIVIAEDRVRLDTVTLLIHDLRSQRMAGLHVRTAKIAPTRTVHFEVTRPTLFMDERLYVLLLPLDEGERPHEFCLLMPSRDLPRLGYSETITLDPLTKRFIPYRVPTDELGATFLKSVFGS